VKCEFCGEWFTTKGIALHKSKGHNVKSADRQRKESFGTGPIKCPECGYGARAMQGLAAHRLKAHGIRGAGKGSS